MRECAFGNMAMSPSAKASVTCLMLTTNTPLVDYLELAKRFECLYKMANTMG